MNWKAHARRESYRPRAVQRVHDAREREPDSDRGEGPRQQGVVGQVATLIPEKGYGFLFAEGRKYFFHRSDFVNRADFDTLTVGLYVTFEPVERTAKGPRAKHLELA